MLKKRLPEKIDFEKYVMRLFAAWCLSAFFFNLAGGATLAIAAAAQTSIVTFALVFALQFLIVSLIAMALRRKYKERADIGILTFAFTLYALITIREAESWYYGLGMAALTAILAFYAYHKGWLCLKNAVSSVGKWVAMAVMFALFVLLVGGTDHTLTTTITGGRGFTAVMVAWLAKFNPFWMIMTSFLLVFLQRGASEISTVYGLNQSYGDILTGIILFFIVGSEFFISYKISFRHAARKEGATHV